MSEVGRVGIVGAGFTGSGIAEACAPAGFHVVVEEPEQRQLERSEQRIRESVDKAASRGKLTAEDAAAILDRITWSDDLDTLPGSDIVIEAVIEDVQVKGRLFPECKASDGWRPRLNSSATRSR